MPIGINACVNGDHVRWADWELKKGAQASSSMQNVHFAVQVAFVIAAAVLRDALCVVRPVYVLRANSNTTVVLWLSFFSRDLADLI